MMVIGILALLILGQGTGEFKPPRAKTPAKTSDAPVTRAEGRAIFVKIVRVADRALARNGGPARVKYAPAVTGAGNLTSGDVRGEFVRLTERYARDFRLVPIAASGLAGERRAKALRMWSANGPIGLSKPSLSVAELGDAAGYFLVRLADLTHTPSHEYTPALMGDGG